MAISPLSIYFNWCNPEGRFFFLGASIYIYIVLYLKKVGPGGGAEHIYIQSIFYTYITYIYKKYHLNTKKSLVTFVKFFFRRCQAFALRLDPFGLAVASWVNP